MKPLEIFTEIQGGKISDTQFDRIRKFLEKLDTGFVYIYVGPKSSQISKNQRGYYRGVLLKILSNETGYDEEELHEIHREKFLQYVPVLDDGTELEPIKRSTSDTGGMDKREMEDFLEKVRRFWAEQGINLPLPNEVEGEL